MAKKDGPDPKEQMRQALERKNAHHREGESHADAPGKAQGGPHGQAAAKRQFRRKAGS